VFKKLEQHIKGIIIMIDFHTVTPSLLIELNTSVKIKNGKTKIKSSLIIKLAEKRRVFVCMENMCPKNIATTKHITNTKGIAKFFHTKCFDTFISTQQYNKHN
jgi:hypothetical protein